MPRSDRSSIIRRPKWSPEEDAQLIRLVEEHGVGNWAAIARDLKSANNRDKKAVRSRWVYQLDPNVNKGPFTAEEENIIFEQYEKVGAHWAEISKALPGRTDGAIKNYWNGHLVKKLPYRKFVKKGKRSKRKPGKKPTESSSGKTQRIVHDASDKLGVVRPGNSAYVNCAVEWGLKYEGGGTGAGPGPGATAAAVYSDFEFSLASEATSKRPKQETEAQSGPENFLKTESDWNPLWCPAAPPPAACPVSNTAATQQAHWGYPPWGNEYQNNSALYPWGVQNWIKDYDSICSNARRNDQRTSCQTAESLLERVPSPELD